MIRSFVLIAAASLAPLASAQIQNVQTEAFDTSATVSWQIPSPSISQVRYGLGTGYELGTLAEVAGGARTLDFEDISVPLDEDIDAGDFSSGGFLFDVANDHSNFARGDLFFNEEPATSNGTTYFFLHGHYDAGWKHSSVELRTESGSDFDLFSLRLSEFVLYAAANQIEIEGTYPSGSTVTQVVTLDHALDGFAGVDDFQVVSFDGAWTGLESVQLRTLDGDAPFLFAVDDIEIDELANYHASPSFELLDLNSNTTYYFEASSTDVGGNTQVFEGSFTTPTAGGGPPPLISGISFTPTDLSAQIEWTTNVPAFSELAYGTTTEYELGELVIGFHQDIVDFEDVDIPINSGQELGDFSSGGFAFDVSHDEADFVNGEVFYGSSPGAFNGSTYFYVYGFYDSGWHYPSIDVTPLDGAPFSLHSLDLSEAATFVAATEVVVTGHLGNGETLRETLFLDGVIDGAPAPADFQTFEFDASWTQLVSLSIQASDGDDGSLVAVDNLILNRVQDLNTQHSFNLEGLQHGTVHHALLRSTDAAGNVIESPDQTFATTSYGDYDPPLITNVLAQATNSDATISWSTSEPSQTRLEHGLGTSYELGSIQLGAAIPRHVHFNEIDVPMDEDIDLQDFSDGGFVFDISSDHSNFGRGDVQWSGESGSYGDGTVYFFLHGYYDQGWVKPTVTMTLDSGGAFSLHQFEIAELVLWADADVVRVTGLRADASEVVIDVTLDKVMDGPGGEDDYELIVLDTAWQDLVSVAFQAVSGEKQCIFALDNILATETESLLTEHEVELSGLAPSQTYHFRIGSADAAGNVDVGTDDTFETGAYDDGVPPTILSLLAVPSSHSAVISWDTDEWALGVADFGLSTSFELGEVSSESTETLVLDFEDDLFGYPGSASIQTPENDDIDSTDFFHQGFFFDIDDNHSNFGHGEMYFLGDPVSYNGTTYFFMHGHFDAGWVYPVLNFTALDGDVFSLQQLDVSEATFLADAETMTFTGHYPGGDSVTLFHTLDQILDGTGPQDDFETLTFGPEWSNLDRLTVQVLSGTKEAEVVLDNIVVRRGGGLEHSVTLLGLAPNTLYYYEVTATDPSGNQAHSGLQSFSTTN